MKRIELHEIDNQFSGRVKKEIAYGKEEYKTKPFFIHIFTEHFSVNIKGKCLTAYDDCALEVFQPSFNQIVYKYYPLSNELYLLWNIGPEECY